MIKSERILRDVFPGRETFSEDEYRLVERIIAAVNNDAPRSRMPKTEPELGSVFEVEDNGANVSLRVSRRGPVLAPRDACLGCWFKNHGRGCYGLRCSRFDREDGNNVWFVAVED